MGQKVLVTVGQPSSALPLSRHCPGPAPACLAIWSQAAVTVDIGLESTPGLHLRPGRAGLPGMQGKRDPWGLCPTNPNTTNPPGKRSLSRLVSK